MTDSYHFHIEPEPRVEAPNFRVGGVYRDGGERVVRLTALRPDNANVALAQLLTPHGAWISFGSNRLSDGCYPNHQDDPGSPYHLAPGELIQRDGQWVAADARIVFPSGAAVLTSGDKIVGRVEAQAEPLTDLIKRVFSHPTPTQHYTVDPNARMKVRDAGLYPSRAPLPHFNQRTAHDPFGPDFIVTKGAVEAYIKFTCVDCTGCTKCTPSNQGTLHPAIAGLLRG